MGDVASLLRALLGDPDAAEAVAILREDFLRDDALSPRRVAAFVSGGEDDVVQAELPGTGELGVSA